MPRYLIIFFILMEQNKNNVEPQMLMGRISKLRSIIETYFKF